MDAAGRFCQNHPRGMTQTQLPTPAVPSARPPQAERLSDLSPQQWRSGIAAWLGWLFDGLDMHIYTLVGTPFVAYLISQPVSHKDVGWYASLVQAAFLVGWALGGGCFGFLGDRIGRSRALMLTILTYAGFTGLSFFAQTWWQLMICRFLSALGVGGEWAVGCALLSETWPSNWRPWLAAVLQTGVNLGVLLAILAVFLLTLLPAEWAHHSMSLDLGVGHFDLDLNTNRLAFLVGILPALLVLWIRKAVPETAEWRSAKAAVKAPPRVRSLFQGSVRRLTLLCIAVCATSLSGHWAVMFWYQKQLRDIPAVAAMSDAERTKIVSWGLFAMMMGSIIGNFTAGAIARFFGYRRSIALLCVVYFFMLMGAYAVPRSYGAVLIWLWPIGICQGVFALFTMYLPPLFPTLLRTTGAGFSYNIGRIAAAVGTVVFGYMATLGDAAKPIEYRYAMLYAGVLFLPAAAVALLLPEPPSERAAVLVPVAD
jgi:MFS family permease